MIRIKYKNEKPIQLGNLYSERDWGYVEDYVEAMFQIINHSSPEDFVVGTGISTSILEFFKLACDEIEFNPIFKNQS